jgi:orotate phosphoribosyltransferase-like protein|tara:strand:- start:8781 stop:9071 length:291 start_codon:yes stop_codon:yes gene_type:complete
MSKSKKMTSSNANLKPRREQLSWEYLGYLASALLVASLTMSDVVKLRWFNLAGCIAFTCYGIAIDAIPVAFTNGLLTFVNIYHIIKLKRQSSTDAK